MKKLLVSVIVVITILSVPLVLMAEEDSHGKSVENVLATIRAAQGVSRNRDINPAKVNDDLLEELGEAVMSLTHPDEKVHEWMDNMMGGEGSESLKAAHIMMGYNYLTGNDRPGNPYNGRMMGIGWGMPMMGNYGQGWNGNSFFTGTGIVIILGILILAGAAITITIILKKRNSSEGLTILKNRLARGEITKEEFDKLKQDIT